MPPIEKIRELYLLLSAGAPVELLINKTKIITLEASIEQTLRLRLTSDLQQQLAELEAKQ